MIQKTDVLTFHDLALYVCQEEGKKKSVNVAQVREILSIIRRFLADADGPWSEQMRRLNLVVGYVMFDPNEYEEDDE